MRYLILAALFVAVSSLAACRSGPAELPHPERGAVWVNVNQYAVPGTKLGADAGFTEFPAPCPQVEQPAQPKPCVLQPASLPDTGAPLRLLEDDCPGGVCAVPAIATMGISEPGDLGWFWIGLFVLLLGSAIALRKRGGAVLALLIVPLFLTGCAGLAGVGEDANDAFLSAIGAAPTGSISTVGDGVGAPEGLVWGGSGLAALASIFLTNFIRNRARKRRGEPVETTVAAKDAAA